MCGFLFCLHKSDLNFDKNTFINCLDNINHRGPDSTGYKQLNIYSNVLKFGHKRLSINDLSKNGSQPIESFTKRFLLIFNGEIYNHLKLRKIIESKFNIKWRGTCDTETLVNLHQVLSPIDTFKLLKGMFAYALYDNFSESLRYGCEIFHALKSLLKSKGHNTNVGDEGGFAPNINNSKEVIEIIIKAIEDTGLKTESDIMLALDVASTEFYNDNKYNLKGEKKILSCHYMI